MMGATFYILLLVSALSVSCMAQENDLGEFAGANDDEELVSVDESDVVHALQATEFKLKKALKELETIQKQVKELLDTNGKCTSCQALYDAGVTASGVYKIKPDRTDAIEVYCEHGLPHYGPGWTVFQRRINGSIDFDRTWIEYQYGFGSAAGEYWLGLFHLFKLTDDDTELLVELKNGNDTAYAFYYTFNVGDFASNYKLTVNAFSSHGPINPGDSMSYHDSQPFTTKDHDVDADVNQNCAHSAHGGFWYKSCFQANPNGGYGHPAPGHIAWNTWTYPSSMRMMLKPR